MRPVLPKGKTKLKTHTRMITIKDLSKKYGNKTVLNGIDLSFEQGKVYGVVGKNGAGKTTLFNCIADVER